MRLLLTAFFCLAALTAAGGEREMLLEMFRKENADAEREFQTAMTTVELTAAAGGMRQTAEKHLLLALDHKLRNVSALQERLKILADFHALSCQIQRISAIPNAREHHGSLANMHLYCRIAVLMQQQTAILMLDKTAEKRWRRIADAPLLLHGKTIRLKQGNAEFQAVMYGRETDLELTLFPADTFCIQGRCFALIRTDIFFAGNDDFSQVFVCELKNGKLQVRQKCKYPYFSKWTLKNNILTVYYGEQKSCEMNCI